MPCSTAFAGSSERRRETASHAPPRLQLPAHVATVLSTRRAVLALAVQGQPHSQLDCNQHAIQHSQPVRWVNSIT